MSRPVVSHIAPKAAQSEREIAQTAARSIKSYRDSEYACDGHFADNGSSKPLFAFCQHRYPSPYQPASQRSRLVSPVCGGFPHLAINRYMWLMVLELGRECVNLRVRSTKQEGNSLCLRNPGSSQQSQHSAWPVVSTMTQSAHLSALASAALLAKHSATTTVYKARLAALSLAHWLTTSKKTLQQLLTQFERRRGLPRRRFYV